MTFIIALFCFGAALAIPAFLAAPFWGWCLSFFILLTIFGLPWWAYLILFAVSLLLGRKKTRIPLLSARILRLLQKNLPELSPTEREALAAGDVWWERELFTGKPDYTKLDALPAQELSAEERAFIEGPVEELCAMLDDWDIVHKRRDLPEKVWQFIRQHGFFALIIEKKYGGLGFSSYAHAKIVGKIASRSPTAAVTVMVPNSLGPGELLQHYGTQAQRDYYLPRLAKGEDIPCFALTSPYAGSDAGAIPDFGVIEYGDYCDPRDGSEHQNVLGIRLTFEKRWMTLGPVATVFGLAFKLKDPQHLLGKNEDLGLSCALLPKGLAGLNAGARHYPNHSPFMNGPVSGEGVFIPLEWLIGGREGIGKGWQMLVECLSIGRAISLPALGVAAGKMAAYSSALYSGIRHQFSLPIGSFGGVQEVLARLGGRTYQMEAAQDAALAALDQGTRPSVVSAILKYHNTEKMRQCVNDALDLHGGRTVVIGPRNYLASAYNATPVGITVEGANILTRSLMIFGQGLLRCHPYLLKEIEAVEQGDVEALDAALGAHLRQSLNNAARAFFFGITNGRGAQIPEGYGEMGRYYRRLNRLSSAFSFASDWVLLRYGAALKTRENLSARLGDTLSQLYFAAAVLKRDQATPEMRPLARWAVEDALLQAENALWGLVSNLPCKCLKRLIFPLGRRCAAPSDALSAEVATAMMNSEATLAELTRYSYESPAAPENFHEPLAALKPALKALRETKGLEKVIREAEKSGQLKALTPQARLEEAEKQGLISAGERRKIESARLLMRYCIEVDEFDAQLENADESILQRQIFLAR